MSSFTPEETLRKIIDGSVTEIDSDTLTSIYQYRLRVRSSLTLLNAPNLESVSVDGCREIGQVGELHFPNLTSIAMQGFMSAKMTGFIAEHSSSSMLGYSSIAGCANLKYLIMPRFTNMHSGTGNGNFTGCTALELVDIGAINLSGGSNTKAHFYNCQVLRTLILRHTSVVTIGSTTFGNTPLRGYNGLTATVYVPSSLAESYKTASNWSTIYDAGYVSFEAIEGSDYESLTWWEDDPTLLPT